MLMLARIRSALNRLVTAFGPPVGPDTHLWASDVSGGPLRAVDAGYRSLGVCGRCSVPANSYNGGR